MKIEHLLVILSVILFPSCIENMELNRIPGLPEHWSHVREQGLDSKVGYFKSTTIPYKIYYDIGMTAGEYADTKAYPNYKWIKEGGLNNASFNYLLTNDNTLYVTFTDEGPANFWAKTKDESEVNYILELLAKYRKDLLNQDRKKVELLQQDKKGNFVLYVSNQSYAETPVDITITLDGKKAVSSEFDVGNQHNWKKHIFKLAPGKYKLVAESKKGKAKFEKVLEIRDEKTWAAMDYWYYPKKDGKRHFTIHIQDKPIQFE